MTVEQGRRWLWYGVWAAAGLWVLRTAILPAQLRAARLTEISGAGPYVAGLSWSYGPGARPASVIFDFEAGPAHGSVTADGEMVEAEIPLGLPPRGRYSITASATYRTFGFAHTTITRAEGGA